MPSAWGAGGLAARDIAARAGRLPADQTTEENVVSTGFPELGGGQKAPGPAPAKAAPEQVEEKMEVIAAEDASPAADVGLDFTEDSPGIEDLSAPVSDDAAATAALLERLEPMGGAAAFLTVINGLDLAELLGLLHVIRGDTGPEGLDIPAWKELSASVQSFGGPRAILSLLANEKVRATVAAAIAEGTQDGVVQQDDWKDEGAGEGPPSSPPPARGPPPAAAPPPAEPPVQVPPSAPVPAVRGSWANLVSTGAPTAKWGAGGKGGLGTAWTGKGASATRPPSEPPPPAAAQPPADLAPGPKPKAPPVQAPSEGSEGYVQASEFQAEVHRQQEPDDAEVAREEVNGVEKAADEEQATNGDDWTSWKDQRDDEWLKQGWTKDDQGWWRPPAAEDSQQDAKAAAPTAAPAAAAPAAAPAKQWPEEAKESNLTGKKLAEWLRRRVFQLRVILPVGQAELLEVLQSLDDEKLQPPFEEAKLWLGLDESEIMPSALEQLLTDFRQVRAKP